MITSRDIKHAEEQKKLLIGTKSIVKSLKIGELERVIYASNCPESTLKDINYYLKLTKTEVELFDGNSSKLGETCGKPFNILMIAIKK
ncbi:MAG: ribosomal L7Ae/L30e/S12e/Gadd45 family protein [Candidatus Aenigmatarchaeota archaeon]